MIRPSPGEIDFIRDGFKLNCRNDGRKNLDVREVWLKPKTLYQANGSCTLDVPDSAIKIYVGIKIDIADSLADKPDEGIIKMSIESINRSEALSKKSKEDSIELHDNIRTTLESRFLSRVCKKGSLVLIPGKKCWLLNVDVFFLGQLDFCYIDFICLAMKVAFHDLELPKLNIVHNQLLDEDDIDLQDENISSFLKFNMSNFPSFCTIGVMGNNLVVDLSPEEYHSVDAVFYVTCDEVGRPLALYKSGREAVAADLIPKIISLAQKVCSGWNKYFDRFVSSSKGI